ncbi:beta-glucosidase [Ophiobolus disseminans]|uniref:Beta-glucosidase n=1 Tax=Ophiobolus disseminans TaxID=1469910 RepID=A0A6A7A3I8_9PLEO|nr:beta-glucosidase [Ophiobolus disseminans]
MPSNCYNEGGVYKAPALKACDACRLRKVRCDVSALMPPTVAACTRCHRLAINCTFDIQSRKRGPKHDVTANEVAYLSPSSRASPMITTHNIFLTDSICSRELLRVLMHDYLESLYCLIPVVHRPSFRRDLDENRDAYDSDFLGLVVALCAVMVAIFRSRFETYRGLHTGSLWAQSRVEVINRCHDLLMSLRGPTFFDEIGHQKWAASYLMSIAFFQVGEHNRARMVEVECMQLGRLLDLHRIEQYMDLDCIETQLRKKAFWLLFYGYIHAQIQNLRKERLTYLDHATLESISLGSLIPVEVDDEHISTHQIIPSPHPGPSLTMGFVVHSRIFWYALANPNSVDTTDCLCCRSHSPSAQVAHLKARLRELKYALDDAPVHFRQWMLLPGDMSQASISPSQLATLRANIHVTHLWLQSILLDQLDSLTSPEENWADREVISSQLLHVLHNTSQEDVEPNGLHLVYKVRDVAVGLLACPFLLTDLSAKRAQSHVQDFVEIMARLDVSETVNTANLQSWVDTGKRNV